MLEMVGDPEIITAFADRLWKLGRRLRPKHMYVEAVNALQQTAILIGDPESGRAIQRVYVRSGYTAVIHEELNRELQRVSAEHYVSPTGIAAGSHCQALKIGLKLILKRPDQFFCVEFHND
jgi:hypothetical protein